MKIAVIGPQFPDSFARNVVTSLEAMGHEVSSHPGTFRRHNRGRYAAAFWEYAPKVFPSMGSRMYRDLLGEVADFRPNAVLVTSDFFSSQVVRQLKKAAQAPVLCWYIDAPANLRGGRFFTCDYDIYFCKEPRLVDIIHDKLGMQAYHLPEACNPRWHRPMMPTDEQLREYGCDVVGQGTAHGYRMKFFEAFSGLEVKIWGSPAPAELESPARDFFQGRFIGEEEKAIAFACGKVFVNSVNFAEVDGVNNTLFEAAGCGTLQLCDETPTLCQFFKPDEEIVTFRSRAELMDKVRHYLDHEEERKKIGKRAAERAHRDHTYERRLQEMFKLARLD